MTFKKSISIVAIVALSFTFLHVSVASATTIPGSFDSFQARSPIHTSAGTSASPQGLDSDDVISAYNLPATGGSGSIAIISAFHHDEIASDMAAFDAKFSLPSCTIVNKCLTVHPMSTFNHTDNGWDMETALDTEWAHAIAPKAKILVVEAASDNGSDLLKAIDYAVSLKDVISVSMSWGDDEFPTEASLESHFSTTTNAKRAFFASSGDDGTGTSWPAVSPKVVAVGGTRLVLSRTTSKSGKPTVTVKSESAWSGSGGGISQYLKQPAYQASYSIPRSGGMRTIPDVSYAADPTYGFSVYHTGKWYVIGGTSAGAPQWAAIHALGKSVSLPALYADKAAPNNASYFRDIVSGKNGDCAYFCTARKRYDYVTGLGSPVTWKF